MNAGTLSIGKVNAQSLGESKTRPRLQQDLLRSPLPGRPQMADPAQRTRGNSKPQAGGRVYCLEADEKGDEDPHAVISGMLLVNTLPVIVLFDAGATHSFINPDTASQMNCGCTELDVQLHVTTLVGTVYQTERVARNCTTLISGRLFRGDLVLLGIRGYDVILGMDWLTQYQATIDCNKKTLTLITSEGERIQYKGGTPPPSSQSYPPPRLVN